MAYSINTNPAALRTQHNLTAAQTHVQSAIARLSSGTRINTASDNAASFAIASGFDTVIRGQGAAIRNVNDAISLTQTADGGLAVIQENLQRMRELAVRSATGTNTDIDRAALNDEFSSLQQEVVRVTHSTTFNGAKVLDGAARTFQVDYGAAADNRVTLQGSDLTAATSSTQKAAGPAALASAGMTMLAQGGSITITGEGGTVKEYRAVRDDSGRVIGYVDPSAVDAATVVSELRAAAAKPDKPLTASNASPATPASDTALSEFESFKALDATQIATGEGALAAIDSIDAALDEIKLESVNFGTMYKRLGSVMSALQDSADLQTVAKGRIVDTDFAAETNQLARGQILQQAGMAMLAQANQLSNGLMSLLR